MLMRIKIIFFLAVVCSLLSIFPRVARAQSLSLSISPPLLEVMIKPGKSITQVYKISNEGETVIAIPRIVEMTEKGLPAQAGIKEDPKFVPEKWISLSNTDLAFDKPFLFEAKTQRQLIVKINPGEGTPEQNYFRAILLSTKPNPGSESTQSQLLQNIGAPLLISVTSTGLIPREGTVSKFNVPRILDSFDTLIVDIDIKNIGKTYFRPTGKITLSGPIGRGTYEVVPRVILSGQVRQVITENNNSGEDPLHSLTLPGLYLGKYEAGYDFALDGGNVKLSGKKVFYALPWKAGVVVMGLIVMILTTALLKSPKGSKKSKESKKKEKK